MRHSPVMILLAALWTATAGGPAAAQDDVVPENGAEHPETDAVIVELVDLGIPGDAPVLAGLLDLELEGVESTAVVAELDLMAADVTSEGLAALTRSPSVASVRSAREDLRFLLDQSTSTIGATGLQLEGFTGAGRSVAVIDSGVDTDHPGLAGSVIAQGCFLEGVPTFQSDPDIEVAELCENGTRSGPSAEPCGIIPESCTHGTAVAGVITGDDALFTGVAPDATIVALRVSAVIEDMSGDPADPEYPYDVYIPEAGVLAALEHVYLLRSTHDIAAVNLSLGGAPGTCQDTAWEDVIGRLTDAGIAVVAASGNSGWDDAITFPACLDDVISVGSTTPSGEIAPFTSTSADLDLLAPGAPVETTVLTSYDASGFAPLQGTSFSSPHVAGAFALVDSSVPSGWSVERTRSLLRATGEMIPRLTPAPLDHDPRFPELRLEAVVDFEPFVDATSGFWVGAADWAKATGVSTGISGNTFGPELSLTRAQAVTFLWRFMGEPDHGSVSGFTDADPTSWYGPAVAWAAAVGVTTGTSPSTFSPDDVVTRGQLAAFMWRTAGEPGPSGASGFSDVDVAAYYAGAVAWMADHAITSGTSPTMFSPEDVVTRAQMVTFEHRLADADHAWTGTVSPPALALF